MTNTQRRRQAALELIAAGDTLRITASAGRATQADRDRYVAAEQQWQAVSMAAVIETALAELVRDSSITVDFSNPERPKVALAPLPRAPRSEPALAI
jgi:hypothetical protein